MDLGTIAARLGGGHYEGAAGVLADVGLVRRARWAGRRAAPRGPAAGLLVLHPRWQPRSWVGAFEGGAPRPGAC
jgi:hypothetical protein